MTPREPEDPLTLGQVLSDELKQLKNVDIAPDEILTNIFKKLREQNLKALCFSGGGIRSATFGLGIVQALADKSLLEKFDYLSTVSGGGYLGSWLSAWILRERVRIGEADASGGLRAYDELQQTHERSDPVEDGVIPGVRSLDVDKVDPAIGIREVQRKINRLPIDNGSDPNPEPEQLQHLREYSNYMSPRVGLLSADTWALIGIYLRNLFLNLTIFVPLIAAVLLLPRLFYALIDWDRFDTRSATLAIVLSILLGGIAIAFVLNRLPSKAIKGSDAGQNTDGWVLIRGVFPLILMAIALSMVGVGSLAHENAIGEYKQLLGQWFEYLPETFDRGLAYFIASGLLVSAVGYSIFSAVRRFENVTFDPHTMFASIIASGVWGFLLWLLPSRIFLADLLKRSVQSGDDYYYLLYVCFSVPLFMLIYLIAGTVFVGLSSGRATDEDREWLARYGGWILIVCVVWIVLHLIVLFGPIFLQNLVSTPLSLTWSGVQPVIVPIIGVISAALSLIGGFSSRSQVRDEPVKTRTSRFLAFAPKLAAVIFLAFIFVGLAYGTTLLMMGSVELLKSNNLPETLQLSGYVPNHEAVLFKSTVPYVLLWLTVLSVIGLFMAFFVNVNKFSLHGAYRDRLVRAYLGASNRFRRSNPFTGFDDADNFQLHRLKRQRPFHIINATLNLVGGKQLAWQDRKAASFTMSPLHSGSWTLGYRYSNEFCRNTKLGPCEQMSRCNRLDKDCGGVENCKLPGKAIRLGTAMAISGAAANPNMGYYSSSVVTFLMSLFNIRLGWWLGNTGPIGSKIDKFGFGTPYFSKSSPTVAVLPLLNETLGRTDENKRYINVTDGGHFENLALYEMVLRRCSFIVLSDGAADASFKFGEIANAIQKCKVDLGVEINLLGSMKIYPRTMPEDPEAKPSRFALAEIIYPENPAAKGYLLYTRPAYYRKEPMDIRNYADTNENFPHQSTGDQMYDEKQFEAYRGLGFLTMAEIRNIFSITSVGDPYDEVDDDLEKLFANDLGLRKTVFEFFGLKNSEGFLPRKKP